MLNMSPDCDATGAVAGPFSPPGRRWPEGPDEGAAVKEGDITKRRPGKTPQARQLRKEDTEEEYRLWGDLRSRRLNGYKFTRQIPLGPYIVDFLYRTGSLVIEVDGAHHALSPRDAQRTEWLNQQGYSVPRFWNHEILRERGPVLETILAALEGRIVDRDEIVRFYPAGNQQKRLHT